MLAYLSEDTCGSFKQRREYDDLEKMKRGGLNLVDAAGAPPTILYDLRNRV